MPEVSVIIPVYNTAPYLKRSIESLINQTLKDIEIIFIDDCSTDNSLEILEEYAAKDTRIKIIKSEKNQGAAIARNKGLDAAKGIFLGFIDPDDSIDLNYYEKLYNAAIETNSDIAKCGRKIIYPDGRIETGNLNQKIKEKNCPYLFSYEWTTAVYSADFIKKNGVRFPSECPKAQDTAFLARVMYKHPKLTLIDNVYYYYYQRKGSLDASEIPVKHIKSALISAGIILNELNNSGLYQKDSRLYSELYAQSIEMIFHTLFQNKEYEAKRLCAEALIENFFKCRDIQALEKEFPYPWLLKDIKNKNTGKLAKTLSCYESNLDLRKPLNWYQKIFSIKNGSRGKHKILYLAGFKISLKKRTAGAG